MNSQYFDFWQTPDGTWSWSRLTKWGSPILQQGFPTLNDCKAAAVDYGFTGRRVTYNIHRPRGSTRPAQHAVH